MNRNHLVAAALVAFMVAGAFAYFDNTLAAGISALVAALLILLWDLARYIEPATYRADVWARRDQETADHELPYQPIDRGAIWPNEIGAPE